jgi:hypothetical protein
MGGTSRATMPAPESPYFDLAVSQASTTHYVPYNAPTRRNGTQQAICEAFVDPATEHAAEPTCQTCRRLIAEDDAALAALMAE